MNTFTAYLIFIDCIFLHGQVKARKRPPPEPYGLYYATPQSDARYSVCNIIGNKTSMDDIEKIEVEASYTIRLDLKPQSIHWKCSSTVLANHMQIFMIDARKENETYKFKSSHFKQTRDWLKRCRRWKHQVVYKIPLKCELTIPLTHKNLGEWRFLCFFEIVERPPEEESHIPEEFYSPICISENIDYNITFVDLPKPVPTPTTTTTTTTPKVPIVFKNKRDRAARWDQWKNKTKGIQKVKKRRLKEVVKGKHNESDVEIWEYYDVVLLPYDLPWVIEPAEPGPTWPWPDLLVDRRTWWRYSAGAMAAVMAVPCLLCFCYTLAMRKWDLRKAEPCPCGDEDEY